MKYFVGIDIGGTNVEIGLSDNTGKILGKKSMKTDWFRWSTTLGSFSVDSKQSDGSMLQEACFSQ